TNAEIADEVEHLVVATAADCQRANRRRRRGIVDAIQGGVGGAGDDQLQIGAVATSSDRQILDPAVHPGELVIHVQHEVIGSAGDTRNEGLEGGYPCTHTELAEAAIDVEIDVGRTLGAIGGGNDAGDLIANEERPAGVTLGGVGLPGAEAEIVDAEEETEGIV